MKCFRHNRRWLALLTALMMLISPVALAERYSTLEYGDRGDAVLRLQLALKELGYDPDGTDGKYGRGTENAVKLYQTANDLEPDGKAGHQTQSKIFDGPSIAADGTLMTVTTTGAGTSSGSSSNASNNTDLDLEDLVANADNSSNPNTIKFGDSGRRVTELQSMLTLLGYDTNGIDGRFGTGTMLALVRFQKANGLNPDGLCGAKTLQMIQQKAAEMDAGSTGNASNNNSDDLDDLVANAGNSSNPNTIKYGDRGTRVTELQTMLTKLGYDTNGIDGRFGTGTLRALVQFQKSNGLSPDGLCGTQTMALIRQKFAELGTGNSTGNSSTGNSSTGSSSGNNSTGSTGSTTTTGGVPSGLNRTLYPGCSGQDVLTVQKRLKELGYYNGSLDGAYGSGSVAAVQAFQQKNGLTADGYAGQRTFKVMFSANAIAANGSTTGNGSNSTDSNNSSNSSNSSNNNSSNNNSSNNNSSNNNSSNSSTTYTTLSYGSRGEAVRKLQQALKELNYNVTADGEYGALTQMAVNAFQQCNGMVPTGTADPTTQALLYSGKAKPYDASIAGSDSELPEGTGSATGPSTSSVKLLHWFREIKPTVRSGQTVKVFDPATNLQWTLRFYSLGRHADSEPLTETDTKIMFKAFGNKNTWTPKPVYVQLPSGVWTLATMHNVPHLSGSIQNNGFDGHLCVHFLRDMDECSKNDPKYGVQNQQAIRKKWKEMTGQVVE